MNVGVTLFKRSARCGIRRIFSTTAVPVKQDPMDLFYAIDTDNSGEITKVEFEEAVDKLSDSEIRTYSKLAFRAIDADGNGTISEEEFKQAIGILKNTELINLKKGLSRNELSNTPESDRSDTIEQESIAGLIGRRFFTTAEVAISKIFPAGFGWQGGALAAGMLGYGATDVPMFLMAGLGDAIGVGLGHYAYMCAKDALGYKQDLTAQAHTSVLLSTACVFSGIVLVVCTYTCLNISHYQYLYTVFDMRNIYM